MIPNDLDDEELVRRLAQGDRQALGWLHDRHALRVFRIACATLGDPAEAEDLVQDVFLELWRRAGLHDPLRGSVRTYVAVLARSRSLDLPTTEAAAVLERVDDGAHWSAGPAPGIDVCPVIGGAGLEGGRAALVRMRPGGVFPRHEHLGDEYTLVLRGEMMDLEGRKWRPGALSVNTRGSEHGVQVVGERDCVVLSVLYGGMRFVRSVDASAD